MDRGDRNMKGGRRKDAKAEMGCGLRFWGDCSMEVLYSQLVFNVAV